MCLGVPGQVRDTWDEGGLRMATVDFGGVTKDACLEYVPEVGPGDWVIVHVGFAITQLDEQAAQETLALLRETGLLDAELTPPGADAGEPAAAAEGGGAP